MFCPLIGRQCFRATFVNFKRTYSVSNPRKHGLDSKDSTARGPKRQKGLKIHFFGSDSISLFSAKALFEEMQRDKGVIASMRVITRTLKVSGRGQNTIVVPELVTWAQQNGIPTDECENPIDFLNLLEKHPASMAVAVSYGKLVPGEYLKRLRYGGLNVHPSYLPELSGAAPIQRAIMRLFPRTGVTVQKLHPSKFDAGEIMWRSDPVKLKRDTTTESLLVQLGRIGAQGLVQTIVDKLYTLPSQFKNETYRSYPTLRHEGEKYIPLPSTVLSTSSGKNITLGRSKAPKINKDEYFLDMLARPKFGNAKARALGKVIVGVKLYKFGVARNVHLHLKSVMPIDAERDYEFGLDRQPLGTLKLLQADGMKIIGVRVFRGWLLFRKATLSGFGEEDPETFFAKAKKRGMTLQARNAGDFEVPDVDDRIFLTNKQTQALHSRYANDKSLELDWHEDDEYDDEDWRSPNDEDWEDPGEFR